MPDRLERISQAAYMEFLDVLDYVWKSESLLKIELSKEAIKTHRYFPDDEDLAELRWKIESTKIVGVFPHLIAAGNLFSSMSLFETYMLRIAFELQNSREISLSEISGTGIKRIFAYFRKTGLEPNKVPGFSQVDAAIKIRNCLMHASGLLSMSRNEAELRRYHENGTYLTVDHRNRRKALGREIDEIDIESGPVGDRLIITNKYSWVATSYLRDYIMALSEQLRDD